MSEMIERVESAISEACGYALPPILLEKSARAAIEAMRDTFDEKHDLTSEHWSTVEIINAALNRVGPIPR